MNPAFWQNRRVFVTGHTGFKGSWICIWLQSMGAKITGFALPPPTQPSLFEMARVAEGMRSVTGDVRDFTSLNEALHEADPEIVIHLAAQALVRYSYQNPVDTYATNVMGTVHLLEAIRNTQAVKAAVIVTSDKCYENQEWVWGYRETDPMGGHDPYSNSKGCSELVTAAYRKSYFHNPHGGGHGASIATARAGNVIGGGDWATDRLIPDTLRAFDLGQPVNVRSPHAIRPWQHVLEPLSGYLLLAEKLYSEGAAYAGSWNFGPDDQDAKPVQWLVEHLTRYWGNGATWQLDTSPQPHEAHYLKLDCSKAHSLLQWHPRWKLEQTLQSIVTWHQLARQRGSDMKSVCLEQIAEYSKPPKGSSDTSAEKG